MKHILVLFNVYIVYCKNNVCCARVYVFIIFVYCGWFICLVVCFNAANSSLTLGRK